MRDKSSLVTFIMSVNNTFKNILIDKFITSLSIDGWSMSKEHVKFAEFGDYIDDESTFIIGFHQGVSGSDEHVQIVRPPITKTPLNDKLYEPFNQLSSAIYTIGDEESNLILQEDHESSSSPTSSMWTHLLYTKEAPSPLTSGCGVYSRDHPAPPLQPYNFNT